METKKEAAFRLFAEGYSASSPEVKALGLKAHTRANYYWEYNRGKGGGSNRLASSGETVGTIDETRQSSKVAIASPAPQDTLLEESEEANIPEDEIDEEVGASEDAEAKPEEPKPKEEAVGVVSEAVRTKEKDGKPSGQERKLATTVADDGIKCTVFLSLQTLSLFRIAASTQALHDGGEPLLLGDFLDTCAEDYFSGRGKKLGLITIGGKK